MADRWHECDVMKVGADECSNGFLYFFTSSPHDGDFDAIKGDACPCSCHKSRK